MADEHPDWLWIALNDGTKLAFYSGRWDNEKQRRVFDYSGANRSPDYWSLFGDVFWPAQRLGQTENLITRAFNDFGGDHRYRIIKKLFRRQLNEAKTKEWEAVIRGPVADWADGRIQALADGELCVDNSRVALKGNTAQMRRYRRQKAAGCCGFCDVEEVCPVDGKTYLLGFNYGH